MGRITQTFSALRARGEKALVPFVTAGDPDLTTTELLVPALIAAGADLVEIGVPFSDPMAEGPTIQRASERALAAGTTQHRVFELVKKLRESVDAPLVLMGYANSFLTLGERNFAKTAAAAGVDGVICVDLPPEEGVDFRRALSAEGIDPILLASPTTTPERLEMLAREARGFLYYVSLKGVTGARTDLATGIEEQVGRIRSASDIPVCVGFGVSTPEHAARVGAVADGVVVGSALVDRIASARGRQEAVDSAAAFVAELKAALPSASR